MKSLRLFLIIGGVLIVVYIVAQLNRPKAINWTESYSSTEKAPFGTYILYNRLKDLFHNSQISTLREPIYNVIADDSIKGASYIIVCNRIDLSKADYHQLTKYIKEGNDVFIAAGYFGMMFDTTLKIRTSDNFTMGNPATPVHFVSPYLDSAKKFNVDKGAGNSFFSRFDTVHAVVLGETTNHKANFIKYNFGKGALYLACDPKLFSNYSLLKLQGAEYAATALSFIKSTDRVIWDEYYSQGYGGDESLMRVFLKSPGLQWAYYISLFSLLIFVLFEIKRRQRIIPVIEPLRNSTLDFVNVVGQVYYEKRNNANIAHKKILYLLAELRDEYQIRTNKLDDEFIEKLTTKLGLEGSFAHELVNYFRFIGVQDHISDRELIELNKLIEQLYIQSR
jgi:hypothetical protein